MSPLPPAEERTVRAVGARRTDAGHPTTAEVVRVLRELAGTSEALVSLVDADAVAGERHVLSAWAHLGRSRARGGARLRDRSAEFVLYLAGDDQLPRALAKVGVSDRTERFVLVTEKPNDPVDLLPRFALTPDPSAFPRAADEATLERLGIGAADRQALPRSAWEGLVLERVALVDLTLAPGRESAPKR